MNSQFIQFRNLILKPIDFAVSIKKEGIADLSELRVVDAIT